MKNIFSKSVGTLCFFLLAQVSIAQRPIVNSSACPNPSGGQRAHNAVMFFLTLSDMNDERMETGATFETVSQIRSISDETICSRLNQIVLNNPKYKTMQDNLPAQDTKYYYRTDNLYYIFWAKRPEYDGKIALGPKSLFIVVSAANENIWDYYF